jgi:hypothetical protein
MNQLPNIEGIRLWQSWVGSIVACLMVYKDIKHSLRNISVTQFSDNIHILLLRRKDHLNNYPFFGICIFNLHNGTHQERGAFGGGSSAICENNFVIYA